MRISTPLTSRARKHKVVIQWVARTTAQCRGRTVVAGTAEAEVEPHTESAIYGIVPIGHTLCTRSGTPHDAASYSRALGYLAGHPGCVAGTHLPVPGDRHRGRRSPADPCHTTVRTGPYTAVRDRYASSPRIRTECGLGFRFHSSPRTAQPLPFPPLGLHPSAQKRSPVRSGYSAVCRPWASWPTGLSFSFGPSAIVSGLAYPSLRLSAFGVPR